MTSKVTEKPKKIKPLLNFGKLLDADLIKRLHAIYDGISGHSTSFPTPPVDMATFKGAIDTFSALVTDALDGGKRAGSAKRKQREVAIKMAMQLGHYVWAVSNNDAAIFNTSGFEIATNIKTPPQPLSQAKFKYVDRGKTTGQAVVRPETQKGAVCFEVRYAVVPTGATPTSLAWTLLTLPGSKTATINNLTPGATYQFQVRALGHLGYSEWSDTVTYICA